MAQPLYIEALGAITPVGIGLAQTMGSFRVGLDFFAESEFFATQGEPQIVAAVSFEGQLLGRDRLATLLRFALEECARPDAHKSAARPDAALPLLLCLPEGASPDFAFAPLFAQVQRATKVPLDGKLSSGFAGGRAALAQALTHALALLGSRRADACYVAGVDSVWQRERLVSLRDVDRLHGGDLSDGLIPGEGGVCLRVALKPSTSGYGRIDGLGLAQATGLPGRAAAVAAQVQAARQALASAGLGMADIDQLASGVAGERAAMQERALALTRLVPKGSAVRADFSPANSIGDSGAAAGGLAIAYLAFLQARGAALGPHALWSGSSDGGLRASVVMSASKP